MKLSFALLLFALLFCLTPTLGAQQPPCGIANIITYPIDTNQFSLVQDVNVPSPRHQGRVHTGEDWSAGPGLTLGQPVRAAAAGRVTYAYGLGWGRDGGVVILEHTFPDGSVAYTQYGHLMATETMPLPERLACVDHGEIIGAIGDARPAPHLHFEVRRAMPDTPGPGYVRGEPHEMGWRVPRQFIANQQATLHEAALWRITNARDRLSAPYGPQVPPLVLADNSLLYRDGDALKRASADGRVIWRRAQEREIVGLTGFQGMPLVTFADGTQQRVKLDGLPQENWAIPSQLRAAPRPVGEWLLYPAPDSLIALDASRRQIVWRAAGVPEFQRWAVAGDETGFIVALLTAANEVVTLTHQDGVVDRALLREAGSLAATPEGEMLAYTRGGLWRVDASGTWTPFLPDAPTGGENGAVLLAEGRLYLFDGVTLHAYNAENVLLWQLRLDGISGLTELARYDDVLLLTSQHGHVVAVGAEGRLCNRVRFYGDDRARQWHHLGADGVLRVAVGDQIFGFDWSRFTRAC